MMSRLSTSGFGQAHHSPCMAETHRNYCFVCEGNNEIKESRRRCWTWYKKGYWICPGCVASINRDYKFECRDRRCILDDDDITWWHEAEIGLSLSKALLKADDFFIQTAHSVQKGRWFYLFPMLTQLCSSIIVSNRDNIFSFFRRWHSYVRSSGPMTYPCVVVMWPHRGIFGFRAYYRLAQALAHLPRI